jgi:hypothetical protein
MHTRTFLKGLCFAAAALIPGLSQAMTTAEKGKIEALIRQVEVLQGAKFVRNGKSYDSADAAKFLRGKWDAKAKEIETAEDFIQKIASASSTSGQPYLIRFADGRVVKCADYLKELLKKTGE